MRKAMILLFIIMLLCIGTALAEQSAAQRIYILDQSDSGSHSTGNDIGITHKGTQYYYDSDGNSRRKTMRSHGCSLYATIHAFQWLTGYSVSDSNVADTIRMFLQDANGGPEVLDWKNNENGHLTGIDFLKTYGVLPTSVSSSNKGQLANLFNQGGVAKYSYSYGNSSHFALAVGMIDDDLDGDGAVETWIHIVDSAAYFSFGTLNMGWACRSFNSHRQLSLSELSFNNNRSENNYSGLEYWMRYDLFKNCTISYGLIPGHIYIGRAIPDGNYIIGCEGEPSLFLDIKGNDYPATNSTGVFVGGQLTGNDAFDKTITWTVKYEGDGYYSIKQFKTDMALSVYSEMVVYQNYGTDTQLWSIIPDGENGYRIRSKCNGYYLDVKSGYPNWGSDVQLSAMRSTRAQGWIFTRAYGYDRTIPDGNYLICCEGEPSLFLDVKGNDYPATNSTGVFVGGQLTGNDAFDKTITWTVKYHEDDGYYSIKQYNTDMALSVYSDMVVYQDYGTKTQRWAIISDGENGYRLQAKYNDFYLDVKSGYPNWGSDVQLSAMRSTSAQGWVFIPSEHVQTGLVVTPSNELLSLMSIKNKDELDTQTAYYSVHIREHIKVEVIYDDGLSEEVNDYDVATWIEHSDDKPLVYGYDFKVAYGDLSDTSEINITLNPLPVYRQPDFSLPAAIITVDESAFEGIAATIVYIPDTCTSIGKWAFKDCTKLTQIRIPANCAIGTDAFSGCVNVLIFSTKGSAAETYANSHANCTFVAE